MARGESQAESRPALSPAQYRSAIRNVLTDAALGSPIIAALGFGGTYVSNFAKSLGASETQVGLLTTVSTIATVAQLGASYIIERTRRAKPVCVLARLLSRSGWVLVVLGCFAPFVPAERRIWVLVLGGGIVALMQAVGYVSWLAWMKELVPESVRGAFLGQRGMWMNLTSIVASFGVAWAIDAYAARQGMAPGGEALDPPQAFMLPFLAVALLSVAATPFLMRVPDAPLPAVTRDTSYRQLFGEAVRDPALRLLLISYMLWNASMRMVQPFLAVFMRQTLKLPYSFIFGMEMLQRVANAGQQRWWGPMADRFGSRPTLVVASIVTLLTTVLWLGVSPLTVWLLLPAIYLLRGAAGAGLQLSRSNLVLNLSPAENPSVYLATFNTLTSLVSFMAPLLGGYLRDAMGESRLAIGPVALHSLQILLLIQLLMRTISIAILTRVHEPGSRGVRHFTRTLARSRSRNPIALLMRTTRTRHRMRYWRRRLTRRGGARRSSRGRPRPP